jgi:predicted secreted protein
MHQNLNSNITSMRENGKVHLPTPNPVYFHIWWTGQKLIAFEKRKYFHGGIFVGGTMCSAPALLGVGEVIILTFSIIVIINMPIIAFICQLYAATNENKLNFWNNLDLSVC